MSSDQSYIEAVVSYYDHTWFDYRVVWARHLAMHFGWWDEQTRSHADSVVKINQVLADAVGLRPGERVLDAGCGVGGSTLWLAKRYGVEGVGVTLSAKQVALARRFAKRRGLEHLATFEQHDFTQMTFPDESFDVVWAQESIAHPPNQGKQAFLREAYRVLRPGGRLMVEDAFRYRRPYPDEDEAFLHTFLSGWAIADIPTNEEFVTWTKEVGFHDLEQKDITANILPSMRYLYRMGLLLYPGEVPLRMLRIRSACQHANARSSLLQWRAYKKGLWYVQTLIARK